MMAHNISDTPTITVTPNGASARGAIALDQMSLSDLQALDRTLSEYSASENSLINASAELLAVCGTLSRLAPENEIHSTRTELARIIIDLKYKVVRLDYPPSVAENLCLLYAIVLDEFILARAWGPESGWENRTLVADLFGFRDGGDRFYNIADRALMQPKVLQEFMEIIYIFLKLGYRGKYSRGNEHERDRLIDRLETALELVPTNPQLQSAGRSIQTTTPRAAVTSARRKLMLAAVAVVAIFVSAVSYRIQMHQSLWGDFQNQRAAAEAQNAVDFVYSSGSGTMQVVPRQ